MAQQKHRVTTRIGDVAYAARGEGPAALFVHGVFLNSYYWRHVMERLSGERRCLAPDLLGHGDTPAKPDQDVSLSAEAELLAAFCEAMRLNQVDVVANDSGSAIAQIFAARHPERIRSLTLTNGEADGNYPPPDFRQVVEMAKAASSPPSVKRSRPMSACCARASPRATSESTPSRTRRSRPMWARYSPRPRPRARSSDGSSPLTM
jgi:pimeloyl-ACP methyl ester carboxylesterase